MGAGMNFLRATLRLFAKKNLLILEWRFAWLFFQNQAFIWMVKKAHIDGPVLHYRSLEKIVAL